MAQRFRIAYAELMIVQNGLSRMQQPGNRPTVASDYPARLPTWIIDSGPWLSNI